MAELTPKATPAIDGFGDEDSTAPHRPWLLRYTSHLGYLPPDFQPQFLESVGADVATDPGKHVRFAAKLGMAGVLYPWALSRPPEERAAVANALRETGMTGSAVVTVPVSELAKPAWVDRSRAGRSELERQVLIAARTACELSSDLLIAFPSTEDQESESAMDAVAANLKEMASVAGDHGVRIALEPMTLLPHVMVRSVDAAVDLVVRAESDRVGIVYDTAHISMMGEDLLESLERVYPHLSLVQFADQPGRVQPGGGELDIASVAVSLAQRGYQGLVDLEHGWTLSERAERDGLRQLREFNDDVFHRLSGQ